MIDQMGSGIRRWKEKPHKKYSFVGECTEATDESGADILLRIRIEIAHSYAQLIIVLQPWSDQDSRCALVVKIINAFIILSCRALSG